MSCDGGKISLGHFSVTAISNMMLKDAMSEVDARQTIGSFYVVPPYSTRELLARLILEEAMETVEALGVKVISNEGFPINKNQWTFVEKQTPNGVDLMDVIDGCCDTIYVATGCLVACGIPDNMHLDLVAKSNMEKLGKDFGPPPFNPATGKYGKPEGWKPPPHDMVKKHFEEKHQRTDIRQMAHNLRAGTMGVRNLIKIIEEL
jgi:predicted HAD superfamily Cof-like phosphohydrolase